MLGRYIRRSKRQERHKDGESYIGEMCRFVICSFYESDETEEKRMGWSYGMDEGDEIRRRDFGRRIRIRKMKVGVKEFQ